MSPVKPGRAAGPSECFGVLSVGFGAPSTLRGPKWSCGPAHRCKRRGLPCRYWQLLRLSTPRIVCAQHVGG
eukprot:4249650-Pyramimonas_sp.AAC.1